MGVFIYRKWIISNMVLQREHSVFQNVNIVGKMFDQKPTRSSNAQTSFHILKKLSGSFSTIDHVRA